MPCLGNTCRKSLELSEDRICICYPHEGSCLLVVALNELVDPADQFLYAGERTSSYSSPGNDAEPAFDLVDPGGIGGCVVGMVPLVFCNPSFDLGVLVGGVVVDDEVNIERWGNIGINVTQEGEELLVSMASLALSNALTGSDVQSSEERGGALKDPLVFLRFPAFFQTYGES